MNIQDQNAPSACQDICAQFKGKFITGFGRGFSLKEDGNHPEAGSDYHKISLPEIMDMMENPKNVAKELSPWIIASSYSECDARDFSVQRNHGTYWALVADIDKGNPPIQVVIESTIEVFGDVFFLVWATPSCKPDDQRWRILVPFQEPLNYRAFEACQATWFHAMAHHRIECDTSLMESAQLLYLPNAGEYYTIYTHIGPLLDLSNWHLLKYAAQYEYHGSILEARRAEKRKQREAEDNSDSPMANVRRWFDTVDVMLASGYEPQGNSETQFHVPGGTKGNYGVRVYPNGRWTSRHDTDKKAENTDGDVCDILMRFQGWSLADVTTVGRALRLGFNPKGIPYASVPSAAATWDMPLPFNTITTSDGTVLRLANSKSRQNEGSPDGFQQVQHEA